MSSDPALNALFRTTTAVTMVSGGVKVTEHSSCLEAHVVKTAEEHIGLASTPGSPFMITWTPATKRHRLLHMGQR